MIWLSIAMMILGFLGYIVFVILLRNTNSRTYGAMGMISMMSLAFGSVLFLRLIGISQ